MSEYVKFLLSRYHFLSMYVILSLKIQFLRFASYNCTLFQPPFCQPRWRVFFHRLYFPFRVCLVSETRHLRGEKSTAGALSARVKETRSASQKIKHLYSAEIFQRWLDSFLISFMASRNITWDLYYYYYNRCRHHHNHCPRASSRAPFSQQPFYSSPLLSSPLFVADH